VGKVVGEWARGVRSGQGGGGVGKGGGEGGKGGETKRDHGRIDKVARAHCLMITYRYHTAATTQRHDHLPL
jgi:hypothetical protein